MWVIKGDTRSLDYESKGRRFTVLGLRFGLRLMEGM